MTIYIVAEDYDVSMFRGGQDTGLLGVALTEELAIEACCTDRHFYIAWVCGPLEPDPKGFPLSRALDTPARRHYPKKLDTAK